MTRSQHSLTSGMPIVRRLTRHFDFFRTLTRPVMGKEAARRQSGQVSLDEAEGAVHSQWPSPPPSPKSPAAATTAAQLAARWKTTAIGRTAHELLLAPMTTSTDAQIHRIRSVTTNILCSIDIEIVVDQLYPCGTCGHRSHPDDDHATSRRTHGIKIGSPTSRPRYCSCY